MADREKVIKGLECCSEHIEDASCSDCPYVDDCDIGECTSELAHDALALVKEQEQAMKEKDGTISNLIAQIKEISQCYERVVRCKDCVNHFYDKDNIPYCTKRGYGWKDDDFCSKAERKED